MLNHFIKTIVLLFVLLCDSHQLYAQNTSFKGVDEIWEEMPQFPGGEDAFVKYITSNCPRFPDAITEDITIGENVGDKIRVRLRISFLVLKDGNIGDVQIMTEVPPLVEKAIVKLFTSSPRWRPAKQCGIPINIRRQMPIILLL